jgi:L-aminopeptidase/D-esterase-like protein
MHAVEKIHAVMLAAGSAFGLDAASGAMQYLEEQKIGFNTGVAIVPIVPSAILFDLAIGDAHVRPDKQMGYQACLNASSVKPATGNHGAGTGATVGKIMGMGQAMKSGIGTSCMEIIPGVFIGALVAVNAFGDVIDYKTNQIVAGVRSLEKGPLKIGKEGYFANSLEMMRSKLGRLALSFATRTNTIVGVIATNATFNKDEVINSQITASNGIAMSVRPAFTMLDGDMFFAWQPARKKLISTFSAVCPLIYADAILNAVLQAEPAGGLPAAKSLPV